MRSARRPGINRVFLFWFAYVFTRPFGASFADYFGKSKTLGGLGLGDGPVSLVLALLMVATVGYLARSAPRPQLDAVALQATG